MSRSKAWPHLGGSASVARVNTTILNQLLAHFGEPGISSSSEVMI